MQNTNNESVAFFEKPLFIFLKSSKNIYKKNFRILKNPPKVFKKKESWIVCKDANVTDDRYQKIIWYL